MGVERFAVTDLQVPFALEEVVFPELDVEELIRRMLSSSSSADVEFEQALKPKARAMLIPSFQKTDFFIFSPLEKNYLR